MEETPFFSNKRIIALMLTCMIAIGAIFILLTHKMTNSQNRDTARQEQLIMLNEIEQLTKQDGTSPAESQIMQLRSQLSKPLGYTGCDVRVMLVAAGLVIICLVIMLFGYLWYSVLRPFRRLEHYAAEIAKGNLDTSLRFERANAFGAFTWAFDHMRREIQKARVCEKEAIENNKTVIATLSHDIKTPISSIRAYAEGLAANMDTTLERKERYLTVIMKKCDEVTTLTNDLFLHSLSDLEKLQITLREEHIHNILNDVIEELNGDKGDIICRSELHEAALKCDRKRIVQVVENIINNARKYAGHSGILVWTQLSEGEGQDAAYKIHIKDAGEGIPPEDMPFIFEKFYRGKNVKDAPGAGLGLYIVKYIMGQMNGEVQLYNRSDGLEVVLVLPM